MFCPKCGFNNDKVTSFCKKCGAPFPKMKTPVSMDPCTSNPDTPPTQNNSEKNEHKKNTVPIVIGLVLAIGIISFATLILLNSNSGSSNTNNSTQVASSSEETTTTEEETTKETTTEEPTKELLGDVYLSCDYNNHYDLIISDASWEEAVEDCENRGGHLVTITSKKELYVVCDMLDLALNSMALKYVWIGGTADTYSDGSVSKRWITGESFSYEVWYPNEPSGHDLDGTKESYLCLWKALHPDGYDIGWTMNDQRENIIADFPTYSGTLGYVCEYEK